MAGFAGGSFEMSEATNYDWVIPNGRAALDRESITDAQNKATIGKAVTREDDSGTGRFWITYAWGEGDIFTPENVQSMCQVDQVFLTGSKYRNFCVLREGACTEPTLTVTYAFYGTVNDTSCPLLPAANVTATANQLYQDLNSSTARAYAAFFMDSQTESRSPVYTVRTRSRIDLGAPLEGYTSEYDDESDQLSKYVEYYEDVRDDYFDAFGMKSRWLYSAYRDEQSRNGITVKWYSSPLVDIENAEIANGDILLAIFSLAFVYFWMILQMKSLFLASFCMLQVLFSLPVAIVVYRSVFQIPYFAFIHILVIFLVLGIGADDVFVMFDGWRFANDSQEVKELREKGANSEKIVEMRMEVAFSTTISAIWTTSFTTIVSFLATAVSPIMPISTFGYLAATAILLNFLLVITLIPAILLTHHFWFVEGKCWRLHDHDEDDEQIKEKLLEEKTQNEGIPLQPLGGSKEQKELERKKGSRRPLMGASSHPALSKRESVGSVKFQDSVALDLKEKNSPVEEGKTEEGKEEEKNEEEKPDLIQKFVEKIYLPVMTFKKGKVYPLAITIVIGFFVLALIAAVFSSQIAPPDESAQFLPEDNMLVELPDELSEDYIPGEFSQFVQTQYAFGIDGFDRGDFNRFDPGKDRGDVKFLNGFDFFPAASQDLFIYACDAASARPCNKDGCKGGVLMNSSPGALKCFLPGFQSWFVSRNPGLSTYNCTRDLFLSELKVYRDTDTEALDDIQLEDKVFLIGFVGDDLKYVRFDFYTSIPTDEGTLAKDDARDEADGLTDQINNYARETGASDSMGFTFSSSGTWVGVETELGIVAGFYQGLMICFPVAFCVLLFSTHNLLVSFLAIFTIAFIVMCVLATIVWGGDTLGIAEAVAGVIVIGFSVDYVIHLGHTYIEAFHEYGLTHRYERFNRAAINMAGTVIAGGVTTLGASIPLLVTQHRFFPTMGALMACTVAFSLTFSLLFFMGSLLLIGPDGDFMDLSWIYEKTGCKAGVDSIKSKMNQGGDDAGKVEEKSAKSAW
eukprot:CAMPEP_0167745184 /NCGR_PEP_ID=MMETSP0110_2-20121227/3011_1 /TAXON_ID=629695 /ORGANISM="Gymnochlora sp., Strain CCMP2014" /LENGTH=1024 /DNA_ID=CAMNT_0007629799 /DNA_START=219 /DNA_END=3290 /DNA_ORIENTATION=-